MPITPGYKWSQTKTAVEVVVELHGSGRGEVDVYASDLVLKINFSPYLLLLDLCAAVDPHSSVAAFQDGCLIVTLNKVR